MSKIPDEWKLTTFNEVVTYYKGGVPFKKLEYSKKGIPVLAKGDIKPFGVIEHSGTRFIDPLLVNKNNFPLTTEGDLLMTSRDLTQSADVLGLVSQIPSDQPYLVNQGANILKIDTKKIDIWFFIYWCNGPIYRKYIKSIFVGSTQIHIRMSDFLNSPLWLPTMDEQKAISTCLNSLSRKIELNHQMNATLEAIAQAIFKSWFTDFDPVRAKVEGRGPEGMDAETAALFPDEFEEIERQEVPKGWEIGTLGEAIELAYGKALKQDLRCSGLIPVYGSNGQVGWHNEKLVNGPGIIVGRKGNPGVVKWSQTDFFPIDTTFYVNLKNKSLNLFYLFYELRRHDLALLGADSAVPGLNRNLAYMSQIIIPPSAILKKFASILAPIFDFIHLSNLQSRTLAEIRDLLLPKLISGEIRVPINDEQIEEAITT